MKEKKSAIIIFDGFCILCSTIVQFIFRRDRNNAFRFLPFQSEKSKLLKIKYGIESVTDETIVLIEDGKVYTKSTAGLRIIKKLGFPWKLLWIFIILPRFIRDPIYSLIANNRYRWFGKRESCFIPDANWEE